MTHARCDMCDSMVDGHKPCVVCFKRDRNSALCKNHRHECPACGESMCPDHSVTVPLGPSGTGMGSEIRCLNCAPNYETIQDFVPSGQDYAERVHRLWLR